MLKIANRSNLKKFAKELLGNNHTAAREKELIKECLTGFERTFGHVSHDHARHLEKIDKILGNCGVEGMVTPDVQYSNTGDTYAMTILYFENKLRIGDWGSIVEMTTGNEE